MINLNNFNEFNPGFNTNKLFNSKNINFERFMSNANLVILNDETNNGPESLPTIHIQSSIV